jgi:ubiquinone/menaquinone biosynthesis C-methylase UbiE
MAYQVNYEDYLKALQFDQRVSGMAALQSLTQVLIDELDPQENGKVLDVGTGTGRLGIALTNMVPKGFIAGIDSGYGMLKVAREKILRYRVGNFFLVHGKAEALPFLHEVFDSAFLKSQP